MAFEQVWKEEVVKLDTGLELTIKQAANKTFLLEAKVWDGGDRILSGVGNLTEEKVNELRRIFGMIYPSEKILKLGVTTI